MQSVTDLPHKVHEDFHKLIVFVGEERRRGLERKYFFNGWVNRFTIFSTHEEEEWERDLRIMVYSSTFSYISTVANSQNKQNGKDNLFTINILPLPLPPQKKK